jgi:hypothetical protein
MIFESGDLSAQYYHADLHLFQNRFTDYRAYYLDDSPKALFLLPACLLVGGNYGSRPLKLDPGSLSSKSGEYIISGWLDGSAETFALSALDRLLKAGESHIYIGDFIKNVSPRDIASAGAENADQIYAALKNAGILYEDGSLVERQWKRLKSDGLKDIDMALPADKLEQLLAVLLQHEAETVRARFQEKKGLFIFSREGVRYCPSLGRGEHQVFFEALVGARHGIFSPYSFLLLPGSDPDVSSSQRIFEKLQSLSILDASGRIDSSKLPAPDLEEFEPALNRSLQAMLGRAQAPVMAQAFAQLQNNKDRLAKELKDIQRSTEEAQALLQDLDAAGQAQFLQFFQEQLIKQEVEGLVAERRGIVMADATEAACLLVVTDPVVLSAPFYGSLVNFFKERFAGREVLIGHAYLRPPARGEQKHRLLPLTEALRTMYALLP